MKLLFMVCFLTVHLLALGQWDTTYSYWDNGNAKTLWIYKASNNPLQEVDTTVDSREIKKNFYYDISGNEVSQRKFQKVEADYERLKKESAVAIAEDNQQLKMAALNEKSINDSNFVSLHLMDSIGPGITLNLFLNDTINGLHYVEKDTSIISHLYTVLMYDDHHDLRGAIRSTNYKVYFLDMNEFNEELVFDIGPMNKQNEAVSNSPTNRAGTFLNLNANGANELSTLGIKLRNQLIFCLFNAMMEKK